ncbi:hypothetical protein [Paenibacillus peoriae]|uniref:hypothetical protein n=1 Tax=Paenibacillus peoriae TaxID=59893 RepID=UPI00208E1E50|nr:hypothetical protein [Paenibacillus peoriae]
MNKIVSFYVPLGISSLIAALTHVIVNAVLARSEHPSFTFKQLCGCRQPVPTVGNSVNRSTADDHEIRL